MRVLMRILRILITKITKALFVMRRGIIAIIKSIIILVLITFFRFVQYFSSFLQFFLSFVLSFMFGHGCIWKRGLVTEQSSNMVSATEQ